MKATKTLAIYFGVVLAQAAQAHNVEVYHASFNFKKYPNTPHLHIYPLSYELSEQTGIKQLEYQFNPNLRCSDAVPQICLKVNTAVPIEHTGLATLQKDDSYTPSADDCDWFARTDTFYTHTPFAKKPDLFSIVNLYTQGVQIMVKNPVDNNSWMRPLKDLLVHKIQEREGNNNVRATQPNFQDQILRELCNREHRMSPRQGNEDMMLNCDWNQPYLNSYSNKPLRRSTPKIPSDPKKVITELEKVSFSDIDLYVIPIHHLKTIVIIRSGGLSADSTVHILKLDRELYEYLSTWPYEGDPNDTDCYLQ